MKSAVLAIFLFSVCANAQTRSVTIHPNRVDTLDSQARHSLDVELKRLLSPAGIEVSWTNESPKQHEPRVYERLVVGSFSGNCSVETMPEASEVAAYGVVLAETPTSDGRILPYFTVNCPRLLRTLSPVMQPLSRAFREDLLGRALARIIAHELFHILAQTDEHTSTGVTQAKLSFENLLADRFELSSDSLLRLQAR
jgi:hypothetical protein